MTPISTAPAVTTIAPPSGRSPSLQTSTSAIVSGFRFQLLPRIEFRHGEIFPPRHIGDFGEGFAERSRRIDADARGRAHGTRDRGIVDRGIGGSGRNPLDDDRVELRL